MAMPLFHLAFPVDDLAAAFQLAVREDALGALAVTYKDKTIVLTGAMIPYAFGSSDGLFNLGSAISFAQVLPAGVWVAMNGTHFAWDDVAKDRAAGVFVRRSDDTG